MHNQEELKRNKNSINSRFGNLSRYNVKHNYSNILAGSWNRISTAIDVEGESLNYGKWGRHWVRRPCIVCLGETETVRRTPAKDGGGDSSDLEPRQLTPHLLLLSVLSLLLCFDASPVLWKRPSWLLQVHCKALDPFSKRWRTNTGMFSFPLLSNTGKRPGFLWFSLVCLWGTKPYRKKKTSDAPLPDETYFVCSCDFHCRILDTKVVRGIGACTILLPGQSRCRKKSSICFTQWCSWNPPVLTTSTVQRLAGKILKDGALCPTSCWMLDEGGDGFNFAPFKIYLQQRGEPIP